MNLSKTFLGAGLLLFLLGLASCGGGSGGGGSTGLELSGSSFGFSGLFGNTSGSGTSNEYPILSFHNIPVGLNFTEDIDPATVNANSIDIKTITVPESQDPLNLVEVPGGQAASVDFVVSGSSIYIYPTLTFQPNGQAVWGFRPKAAYEIKFSQPPTKDVVTSVNGNIIQPPLGKPVAFITSEKVYDQFSGKPEPTFFYRDETVTPAQWVMMDIYDDEPDLGKNTSPRVPIANPSLNKLTQRFRVYFSEPVLPSYDGKFLVNTADHTSEALELIYYETFPDPYYPVPIPGLWFMKQNVLPPSQTSLSPWTSTAFYGETYVEYIPNEFLQAMPSGEVLFLSAQGIVADLSGNTKGSGFTDKRTAVTEGTAVLADIEEDFSTTYYEDVSSSSAIWGEKINTDYFLAAGGGGGDGSDGKFYPPNFIPEVIDPADVDVDNKLIHIASAYAEGVIPNRVWKHYEYNLTSLNIPYGWTVKVKELEFDPTDTLPERMDLSIYVTGTVNISGTLDVSGGKGVDGTVGLGPDGSAGGVSYAGGASGGQGGGIPSGGDTLIINGEEGSDRRKAIDYNENGVYSVPTSGVEKEIVGITGVSTDLGDFYLEDATADFRSIESTIVGQMLQPNVGMGPNGAQVVHNHPTFYIEKVDEVNDHKIWVISDPMHPLYRGKLTQPSQNPYIPVPPIAKTGDPYILGFLKGHDGVSSTVFGTGGVGGDPMTVAQTLLTLAAGGGGGGGSNSAEGLQGESGPNFDITQGGNSTPESEGGLGGGLEWDAVLEEYVYKGVIKGTISTLIGSDELVLTFEDPGYALTAGALDGLGYRINPNTDVQTTTETTNDWLFVIESNTEDRVKVLPVGFGDNTVEVTDPRVGVTPAGGTAFILYPPETVGGSGGGGSGMELTGTYKTTFQPPFQLPRWLNGAGGGSGGGAVILESAHAIKVTASGSIRAEGGMGGELSGLQVHLPGGGGGSGGNIILRSGEYILVQFGGLLSAQGGEGRDDPDTLDVIEGRGGPGLVRLENKGNSMDVSLFSNDRTIPAVQEIDLGEFVPLGQESLGLSHFYATGVIVPEYMEIQVIYQMEVSEDGGTTFELKKDLVWSVEKIWVVPPDPNDPPYWDLVYGGDYEDPSFLMELNEGASDPETGYLDPTMITETYLEPGSFLLDSVHPFYRFKIQLWNNETVGGPSNEYIYKNPRINKIILSREQKTDP
jgi:hypothetical protein